jgi:hypothetical protein
LKRPSTFSGIIDNSSGFSPAFDSKRGERVDSPQLLTCIRNATPSLSIDYFGSSAALFHSLLLSQQIRYL